MAGGLRQDAMGRGMTDSSVARPRRRVFRIVFGAIGAVAVVVAAYLFVPRRADLTAFDPVAMARAETTMWRHYYDKRYLALLADLYGVARDQYGFSPWTSVRIAVSAARAAKAFQPTTSRAQAQVALPLLVDYYALLAPALRPSGGESTHPTKRWKAPIVCARAAPRREA